MTCRYTMLIQWSDEDRAYITTLPEFGGCMTHGETYEDAARMGQEALESLIEAYQADGRPLPEPQLFTFPAEEETPGVRLEGSVG
jgi:antitoxin HicB